MNLRKLALVFGVSCVLLALPVLVEALDIKGSGDVTVADPSSDTVSYSAGNPAQLPDGYTVYSKDGSAFYITRINNGVAESVSIYVPASRSLLIPAPEPRRTGDTWYSQFVVSAQTDSVYVIPWKE